MFRRKARQQPSAPQPAWQARVDDAARLISAQSPPAWLLERVAQVQQALAAAEDDRSRLDAAVAAVGADRATAELKAALRAAPARPTPDEANRLQLLRERHEAVHRMRNQHDELVARIERAVVDLELLAVRAVESAARRGDLSDLDGPLARLRDDLAALDLAHEELRGL